MFYVVYIYIYIYIYIYLKHVAINARTYSTSTVYIKFVWFAGGWLLRPAASRQLAMAMALLLLAVLIHLLPALASWAVSTPLKKSNNRWHTEGGNSKPFSVEVESSKYLLTAQSCRKKIK